MSKQTSQPAKKQKVDEEYEPVDDAGSGSSSVQLYSDELEGEEVDLQAYLQERDRLIAEEQAEKEGSGSQEDSESEGEESSESQEEESSEEQVSSKVAARSKRRRHSASSSE